MFVKSTLKRVACIGLIFTPNLIYMKYFCSIWRCLWR